VQASILPKQMMGSSDWFSFLTGTKQPTPQTRKTEINVKMMPPTPTLS